LNGKSRMPWNETGNPSNEVTAKRIVKPAGHRQNTASVILRHRPSFIKPAPVENIGASLQRWPNVLGVPRKGPNLVRKTCNKPEPGAESIISRVDIRLMAFPPCRAQDDAPPSLGRVTPPTPKNVANGGQPGCALDHQARALVDGVALSTCQRDRREKLEVIMRVGRLAQSFA